MARETSAAPTWLQSNATQRYAREDSWPFRMKLARWLGHLSWAPRGQDKALRTLIHPDTCDPYYFEVDFFGKKYRGNLAHFIDWTVFCYGAFAGSELAVLQKVVSLMRSSRSGPINCLDIGANSGHHTLFMSTIADQVVAFEPYPPLQSLIRDMIALNGLMNVKLMPFGLGESDESLKYYPGSGANSGVGSFLEDVEDEHATPITLEVRRGETVLEELEMGPISVLKIDVQGFEADVLRGLQDRILRDRPVILTELTGGARKRFGSEQGFRDCLYPGAYVVEVSGKRNDYELSQFRYETADEVLIAPPEIADGLKKR
jgi:FkbM family methyltransferase